MNTRKNNRKYILFLLVLGLLGFVFSKNIPNHDQEVIAKESLEKAEECESCGSYAIEEVPDSEPVVVELSGEDVIDVTGEVLAETDGNVQETCREIGSDHIIDVTSNSCSENTPDIDFNEASGGTPSGDLVKLEDATFKLERVTYPMFLWTGKYVMKSSNKEITKEDPAYNANGEQIDMDRMRSYYDPQMAMSKESELQELDYYRDPFEVRGSIDPTSAGTEGDEQEIRTVVESTMAPISPCGKEVTESDFNPETSNKMSQNLYLTMQAPDSDGDAIGDEYESIETHSCLPGGEVKEIWRDDQLYTACSNPIKTGIISLISKIFGGPKWEQCDYEKDENDNLISPPDCLEMENITVKMSPIFGNLETCEDGVCTNVYMTNITRAQMSPSEATEQTFQIKTPCKLKISSGGKSQIVDVSCLWDATPVLLNHYQQEINTYPDQDDFPYSFEEYWRGVMASMDADKPTI